MTKKQEPKFIHSKNMKENRYILSFIIFLLGSLSIHSQTHRGLRTTVEEALVSLKPEHLAIGEIKLDTLLLEKGNKLVVQMNDEFSYLPIIEKDESIEVSQFTLKEVIRQYIDLWQLGDDFRSWFEEACGVYATLVDRIVPGFPRKDIQQIQEKLQYEDKMVVQGEAFHLWVIEAPQSVAQEFPADKAGLHVLFVPSEEPYHERKVTLLNGPHTVLSPVAFLSGVNIVRDACQHPIIGRYIHRVMFDELMPTLNLPQEELVQFANSVLERFNNPFVDHQVTSIMLNSFPKYETRDLPGLKTYLQRKGCLPEGLVMGLAAIITYYKGGKRADGTDILPNDAPEILELLQEAWQETDYRRVAEKVLAATFIWKEDLNQISGLTEKVAGYLEAIAHKGMLAVVEEWVSKAE